jgi:putative endopeptidase
VLFVTLAPAPAKPTVSSAGAPSAPVSTMSSWGVDLANLDRAGSPCGDFYQYAVGGWLKSHPIPPAYPRWGQFNEINQRNEDIQRKLLEKFAADRHAVAGSNIQKLGDFYAAGMDEVAIERTGLTPLQPMLKRIDALKSIDELGALAAELQLAGVGALFDIGSGPDEKNSDMVIAQLSQGGLGLPDRDYYTKTDDNSKKTRDQYVEHVARMLTLGGTPAATAEADARQVLDVETKLAQASKTRVQLRDPEGNYHKMSFADAEKLAPHVGWPRFLEGVGLNGETVVNVGQPEYFQALDQTLASVPLATWKIYLRWHVLHSFAPYLHKQFVDENFKFYSQQLQGTKALLPRWKRVLSATNGALGFALGQEFVKVAFPPHAKARALAMVNNLRKALHDDIERLDWMGPETKVQAQAKLAAIVEKIGYPDKWRDYSALHIDRKSYVANVIAGNRFEAHRELRKIGHPPDRTEWGMTPQTVNAYYDPNMNEIVFPAGILQPPFFSDKAEDAVNYGGIGAVIGHEMTHGFDDQGSQYDAKGNLRNWWTKQDRDRFEARATCVANEYEGFFIEPNVHLQGHLVMGESIADLGGLTLAWYAWQKSLEGQQPPPDRDGFTAAQRFFLSYGQIWAMNARPEYARMMATVDPHPPPKFRVNGTVSNMPQFWQAWGCKAGETMERAGKDQCAIW